LLEIRREVYRRNPPFYFNGVDCCLCSLLILYYILASCSLFVGHWWSCYFCVWS